MPIQFACPCGKKLSSPDGTGGKSFDCPACKAPGFVPSPAAPGAAPLPGSAGIAPAVAVVACHFRAQAPDQLARVAVVNFNMPFWSLVWMIVKFELASLIAGVILLPVVLILLLLFWAATSTHR